ncbi:MAG: hypothetical protein J6333_07280 [Planctomycetes bacterium]|nr:hypothetical protein [Planctomycetota bacterium]
MLISWHWCSFPVPDLWEVTGYSAFSGHGDMDFHTRDGFMGRFSWRVLTKGAPDERATLSAALRDHVRQLDEARAATLKDPEFLSAGPFTIAHYGESDPCMACGFLKDDGVLVQWVFPQWAPELYRRDLAPILKGTRPHQGAFQDWSLFGLLITLPRDWTLRRLDPLPGNVSATWENAKHVQITMRRWAMAKAMLEEYTLELLARKVMLEQNASIKEIHPTTIGGFPGVHVDYLRRGEFGFEKIVGRWWTGTADMWVNLKENRVYCLEQIGHRRLPRLDFAPLVEKLLRRVPAPAKH